MKKIRIAGLRQMSNLAQIDLLSMPKRPGSSAKALAPLAENGINLDFLVIHSPTPETINLVLALHRNHLASAMGLLQAAREKTLTQEIAVQDQVGMVSIFPHGNRPAVLAHFLSAFRDAGSKLPTISVSLSAISGLIEERLIPDALNTLGEYFELP